MSNAADPLGVDILAVTDIDPHFTLVWGQQNLQAALLRRISSPAGCMVAIGGDSDYGYDLPGQLNNDVSQSEMAGITAQVQREIDKDPRVQSNVPSLVLTGDP